MAARRLMPGGRGVAERRRDELSASPLRRGASTQTSWTSSAQVHKRLRGGRYRTGNAIYELQFLGDLWSVEIKASKLYLYLVKAGVPAASTSAFLTRRRLGGSKQPAKATHSIP